MSFTSQLTQLDRQRMRVIVRKTHAGYASRRSLDLTDIQCDDLIDLMAPDIIERSIRAAVDTRTID